MSSRNPLVEVEDLRKVYPVRRSSKGLEAVSGVSFSILPGERVGLIGESGSGKTTVGRCLLRLTEVTSGVIRLGGDRIDDLSESAFIPYRQRVQMVFQDPFDSLNPRFRIRRIIGEPLRHIHRLSRDEIWDRVAAIAEEVGIDQELLDKRPGSLTTGQAQRVVIARAVVTNPELIVLDEPTSALDMVSRGQILDLLLRLQEERGLTYLLISHDLTSVKHFCTRILVMYLGTIVEEGETSEIFQAPRHPYTMGLLSSFLPPDPDDSIGEYKLEGEIPSPIDRPSGCPLVGRCPEEIDVCSLSRPELTPVEGHQRVACFVAGTPIPESLAAQLPESPNQGRR